MIKFTHSQEIIQAVKNGDTVKVKELINKNNENLRIEDRNGYTVFHVAVTYNKFEIAKFLAEQGADISKPNKWNEYPLHRAVVGGKIKFVKLFVESKADINVKNYRKDTPLDIAISKNYTELVDYLKKNGADSTILKVPKIQKLADNIYTITYDYGLYNNTLLCTGKNGNLIVDPAFSRTANDLNKEINKINKAEVLYIINSHNHGDHIQANDCFEKVYSLIKYENLSELDSKKIITRENKPIKGKTNLQFNNYYEFNFKGEKILIIPAPGTHSKHDIITYFSTSNVVYMGDLLLSESFPSLSRKIPEYLKILDTAIEVFPDDATFVPGHGKIFDKTGLIVYRKMLDDTKNIILNAKNNGKTVKEIKEERLLKDYETYNILLDWLTTDFWTETIYNNF